MKNEHQALSGADMEHFLEFGFVCIENCFDTSPGSVAHRWVEESWARNGLDPDDPSSWPADKIHMPNSESALVSEMSPKALAAMGELCGGQERIQEGMRWSNGFIANYGWGRDEEWKSPSVESPGWHVDGDSFVHFLDSPELALLVVVIFSEIRPRGGGTLIACDSPGIVARCLAEHPEGLEPGGQIPVKELVSQCRDFRELTGKPGDVVLLHPFIIHASSYNHLPVARFMINPPPRLKEPMRFERNDGSAYSVVERSILNALGKKSYDFRIATPRRKVVPARIARQQALLEQEKARLGAG